ncbi:MAG: hypothetical protein OQK35_07570 [Alphaproteobacteria bacterium]|nr:hypothetical protein [Rhodospirillales bacterium]MCW9046176.1 hypothetical protein [Alphaproteobacteria bacterium]
MFSKKNLVSSVLAIGLVVGSSGVAYAASDEHSHDGHGSGDVELTLNAGKKWPGDDSLRKAMGEIRTVMASRLIEIHENRLPAKEYKILAQSVQGQIDYMVENCKLPVAEDEQLHIVLNPIIEGIEAMEEGANPRSGAVKIVKAHNAYGKYFNHPGWKPLGKNH